MKKLFGLGLLCGLMFTGISQATTLSQVVSTPPEYHVINTRYIDEMGFKILNANGINKHIVFEAENVSDNGLGFGAMNPLAFANAFRVKDDVTDSQRTLFKNRTVIAQARLFEHATSDDEVAALVSHEIAHCLQSYTGIFRGTFHGLVYAFTSKKQNYDADKKAVDLMVKAGYNPVALITILNKTAGQYRFDIGENALTTKRIRKINEYITASYPKYIASYASNPYYKNAMNIIKPAEQETNFKTIAATKEKKEEAKNTEKK